MGALVGKGVGLPWRNVGLSVGTGVGATEPRQVSFEVQIWIFLISARAAASKGLDAKNMVLPIELSFPDIPIT